MKYPSLFLALCLFAIASAPRLFSLDAHWSSDEAYWLRHSAKFVADVENGEFSETLVAHHPGIVTLWLAGLRTLFIEPRVGVRNLVLSRWFISVTVLIGLGVAFVQLHRLLGSWISIIASGFLLFSPLLLAQSRRLHTDALAAVFCLLTVLSLLLYCESPKKQWSLIGAGIAFGLACLAKSYSLVLLLWIPICFLLLRNRERGWSQFLLDLIGAVLCFLSCALLTAFALMPVFWDLAFVGFGLCLLGTTVVLYRDLRQGTHKQLFSIIPSAVVLGLVCVYTLRTVWTILEGIGWALTTPHNVKHFFLGKILNDPGWLFYPFVLSIKSTPLILPLAVCGCIFPWQNRHREEYARQFRIALALILVVLLFIVCLSLTSKKFSRYLLPAFPVLEILAAIGLVAFLRWSYSCIDACFGGEANLVKLTISVVILLCFLLVQIIPVLRLHPYYGTYYNLCWKLTDITKIITVGEASGLDLAAKYLNAKPNAANLKVQVSPLTAEFFNRYFVGKSYRSDFGWAMNPDYEVVYIRDSQIRLVPQAGTLNGTLECVITLNGVEHAWIYRL